MGASGKVGRPTAAAAGGGQRRYAHLHRGRQVRSCLHHKGAHSDALGHPQRPTSDRSSLAKAPSAAAAASGAGRDRPHGAPLRVQAVLAPPMCTALICTAAATRGSAAQRVGKRRVEAQSGREAGLRAVAMVWRGRGALSTAARVTSPGKPRQHWRGANGTALLLHAVPGRSNARLRARRGARARGARNASRSSHSLVGGRGWNADVRHVTDPDRPTDLS